MGLRDEFRKSIGTTTNRLTGAVEGVVRAYNERGEQRATDRRWSEIDDRIEKAAREAMEAEADEAKGAKAPVGGGGQDLPGEAARDPKAIAYNPFDLVAMMGYRDRPSSMTYASLEMVGRGVPVVADVIGTRVSQVAMFTTLPEDRYGSGFKVRARDSGAKVTPVQAKRCRALEQLILSTGYNVDAKPHEAVSFTEFARQFIEDSLIFDQGCFEVVPDRKGLPSYFAIVDPATIRLLDPAFRGAGDPFAVQVIDGSIVTDFTRDELAFCTRRPRSSIRSFGYGTSEIETLVREITGFLWAIEFNRKYFTNGSATKGILNFKGTIPDKHLQAFRRQWYSMVAGVQNAWRTPITNAEDLQWINLQMSNRDMEYSAWMDFLIKIVCSRFQIAPEEVNFSYGNTGQSQAMGQAPIAEKLAASRDLGLRPLVRWFFTCVNRYFLQRVDPDFEVVPVGLDERGAEVEVELLDKQTKVFLTVNEARERMELEPMPEGKGGDAILNPTWLQYVQGQANAGGMGGDPNDPNGGGMPPGAPGSPVDGQGEGGEGGQPGEAPDDAEGMSDEPPDLDLEDDDTFKALLPWRRPAIQEDAHEPIVRYIADV